MSFLYFSLFISPFVSFHAIVHGSQCTERRLMELENIIKTQQKQLDDLCAEKNAEIWELKERIDNLEAGGQVNRKYQARVNEENLSIGNDIKDDANLENRCLQRSENVAFYVYLSEDRCYENQETFIFDIQETNIGNGYSAFDGVFVTPVNGTYVFTVTVGTWYNTWVTAEILVNGKVNGTAFANMGEYQDHHSGSGTIVVTLNAGDHVYVRRGVAGRDCSISSNPAYTLTAFSGWLLF